MRFNRRFLGAGVASTLVVVAVQKLRLLRSADFGKWELSDQASGELEKQEQARQRALIKPKPPINHTHKKPSPKKGKYPPKARAPYIIH